MARRSNDRMIVSTRRTTDPVRHGERALRRGRVLSGAIYLSTMLPVQPTPHRASQPAALVEKTAHLGSARSFTARPGQLAARAQEALVIQHPGSYLRYRMHVVDEKGDHVRDQIETPGRQRRPGSSCVTAAPSPPRRMQRNANDSAIWSARPAMFARHIKNEQANKKMGVDMLKLMPEAMLWSYTPGQPQPRHQDIPDLPSNEPLVVLDFKPNPAWSPPNIPAQALTGLEGRIWIDPATQHMVRLQGALVRPVNIGWGVVAHLFPGGTISLQQTHVAGERWIAGHVEEQLVVRALMLKTIHQRIVYDTFAYQVVPPMTYQDAVKALLATPLPER